MEESKRKAFCEDVQGIEENLASLLIDSWFRNDLDEFVVTLEILNNLADLHIKICGSEK
jgi:hypothetical protein